MHGIRRLIYSGKTKFQNVEILELYEFGKALILDGKIQSAIIDEHMYHEALVHPSMLAHPEPRQVLIIGGGEGATAREVLKHRSVERVVMVDLDREVVELCKKYLPEWNSGVYEDPRLEVLHEDGREYLKRCRGEFDVIIVDVTDPLEGGPSYLLYTLEFYKLAREALKSEGIIVTQATSVTYSLPAFATIVRTMNAVFPKTAPYYTMIPSFTAQWGFSAASAYRVPSELDSEEVDRLIEKRISGKLRYYDGITHKRMFTLERQVREELRRSDTIATDDNPVFMPA